MIYSYRKEEILRLVKNGGHMLSYEVASKLDMNLTAASTALQRYYKQGLLTRERIGRGFIYTITDRGEAHLRWAWTPEALQNKKKGFYKREFNIIWGQAG